MPFASFRYLSARLDDGGRVAPNLNRKVENATLKNYSVSKDIHEVGINAWRFVIMEHGLMLGVQLSVKKSGGVWS